MKSVEEMRQLILDDSAPDSKPLQIVRMILENQKESLHKIAVLNLVKDTLHLELRHVIPLGGWSELGGPLDDEKVNCLLETAFEDAKTRLRKEIPKED